MTGPQKGKCEKCGKRVEFEDSDYCAVCSKDLCPECMQKGCCGNVPAKSGTNEDFGDDKDYRDFESHDEGYDLD